MEGEASRTAVLVCQARAVADGRLAPGRFGDPVAWQLLLDNERMPVDRVRAGTQADDWRDRMRDGFVEGSSTVLAARTVAIDDAIREARHSQIVVLGAGLDARAYRLDCLRDVSVFEVDHPLTQQDKRSRVGEFVPIARRLEYVPVDFRHDSLATALAGAGHDPFAPTTWVWEGVLPYLTDDAVTATLAVVQARSAATSRLIATYSTSNVLAGIAARAVRAAARVLGAYDPLAGEPHISAWAPDEIRDLLAGNGFRVSTDEDLNDVARRLGISSRRVGRHMGRIVVADRS